MANPQESNKEQDFPKFCGADKATIAHSIQKLTKYLENNIRQVFEIPGTDEFYYDDNALFEVLNRVEMRRIYFHVFHNGIEMGELNEGSLLCFWILKLMPFQHKTTSTRVLNVKIALCLFCNMLQYVASRQGKVVNKSKDLWQKLAYAFQYRDLSKEALMMLAETFIQTK